MPGSRADATRTHWLGVLAKYKQEGSGPDARGMWSPSLDAASRDEIRAIQNAKLAALTPFLYENSLLPPALRPVRSDANRHPLRRRSAEMAGGGQAGDDGGCARAPALRHL